MSNKKKLVLIGCGGHARSVADIALIAGYTDIIFLDSNARPGETIFGFPVTSDEAVLAGDVEVIIALGDNEDRCAEYDRYADKNFAEIVSPTAHVGRDAEIGRGTVILQDAHVGPEAKIGENTIINTKALVEHECVIGAHTHISVNSTVAGRCKIGSFVFVGAGSVVRDGKSVCDNVVIGAGAVVVKHITEPGIYAGTPAVRIK